MYRIYYAEKDTTLYEKYPDQNTGIDQILELTKVASGSKSNGIIQAKTFNSRILIDFGTEITALSSSIVDNEIPEFESTNITSASAFLNLHATDASDLLQKYTIHTYPVSESWANGSGIANDTPYSKIGSSWYNSHGDNSTNPEPWKTGSAQSITDGIGATIVNGGGTYITASGSNQEFINQSPDLRIDITNIVKGWIDGTYANNGIIIKRDSTDEKSGEVLGSIKYFGRESHTIFVPRLEVCWDDLNNADGNVGVISANTYVPYFKNIKPEYRTSEITRFYVGVRPEFPTKSYQTSSFYITSEKLPVSSSYEIIDSVTNDVIIKDTDNWVDSTTKISNNSNEGSYFNLRMDSFMPERYYKIKLTCRRTNDTQTFDDFYFKVVK